MQIFCILLHFNLFSFPQVDRPSVMLPTRYDILQQDANMLIPVRPGLFMVEAQGVEQLVLDDGLEDTTLATQRHHLGTTTTPNKRETPEREQQIQPLKRSVSALGVKMIYVHCVVLTLNETGCPQSPSVCLRV